MAGNVLYGISAIAVDPRTHGMEMISLPQETKPSVDKAAKISNLTGSCSKILAHMELLRRLMRHLCPSCTDSWPQQGRCVRLT